jgi:hypothetical protein
MTIIDYQIRYTEGGFFWNEHLSRMISEYSGKKLTYIDPRDGSPAVVSLFELSELWGGPGRRFGAYQMIADYLGEDVAPVGMINTQQIKLLLTESGRLFGFSDYAILQWGQSSFWRDQLTCLLDGCEETLIGIVDGD